MFCNTMALKNTLRKLVSAAKGQDLIVYVLAVVVAVLGLWFIMRMLGKKDGLWDCSQKWANCPMRNESINGKPLCYWGSESYNKGRCCTVPWASVSGCKTPKYNQKNWDITLPTVYQDADFKGDSKTLNVGVNDMGDGWNSHISSLRVPMGYKVAVYDDDNAGGAKFEVGPGESISNFKDIPMGAGNFNDAIEWIVVTKV